MGNERWFLGDRDDREQDFDWHELAAERGIAREQAVSLYNQAMTRAARTPWDAQAVYVALLDQAQEDTWRPSPGKVTRTMRRAGEDAGEREGSRSTGSSSSRRRPGRGAGGPQGQRGRRPLAPGKRALSSYLRAGDEARAGAGLAPEADMDHADTGALGTLLAEAEQSSGMPLDAGLRQELERIVGSADMSGIRVHTGEASQHAARAMNARAFTRGSHIHFGAGRYEPGSVGGRRLIAHEVAHAVQQQGAARRDSGVPTVGASDTAHEREADRFATGFARGLPARALAPISRGRVAEQTVQRLQDPVPEPDLEDLVAMVSDRLRQKRAEGPAALQAEVRALRAQSTGDAREAVEQAIVRTLTPEEITALEGGGNQEETTPTEGGNGQGNGTQTGQNGNNQSANNQNADGQNTNGQNAGGQNGSTQNADGQNANGQNADGQNADGQNADGQNANANGPGNTGDNAAGNRNAGASDTTANAAPAPMTTEQALQPVAAPPADQRTLIQNELAFHESWSAMRGSTLDRAGRLLSAEDLLVGGIGAGTQVIAGGAIKALATRIPVPGLGNMIGGGLSAYSLFSNGGAGLRSLGSSIAEGFRWEGKGPWQIAADVVGMIKSVLDLIGNICNILSGLAYAFAAIAAIGGLLSVFFPPLAFLVPYIPTAINFGRACGGVATVCMSISDLISPIPPILRAIHILVSDQDPLLLAQQEQQYHGELQGAIASYGAASVSAAMDGKRNPIGQMTQGAATGFQTTRGAVGDMRAGNADVRRTFGFQGQGAESMRGAGDANGRRYFGAAGEHRVRAGEERDLLESRQTKAEEHRRTANERAEQASQPGTNRRTRREATFAERRAQKHERRVEQSQRQLERAQGQENRARGFQGEDPGGEVGNTLWGVAGPVVQEGLQGPATPESAAEPVTVDRDERGHVVLPEPPGSLEDVDAHDQAIEQLQQQLRTQQQLTQQATAVNAEATQRGTELSAVHQTVDTRMQDHETLNEQHTRVAEQNQDITQRTEQQHNDSGGGLSRAGEVLSPLMGPARTVNGLVQRVPSNRFFDVSGTQNDLNQFVQGMEQITGGSEDAAEQRNQTQQVVDQRQQQTAEAGELHGQTSSEGSELLQCVATDQSTAASVAQEATAQRDQSQQQEQTLEQQIQQNISQRDQKWNALAGWAQQHFSIRQQATQR